MKNLVTKSTALSTMTFASSAALSEGSYSQTWVDENTEINTLELDENNKIRYLKSGHGQPLLLIHTIRTQLDYFEKIIPALSQQFTVYALDLPGHGYSSIIDTDYSEPYFRHAVIKFIEALDLNNLTIAGESIGAVLALTVAAESGQRIKQVYAFNPYDHGDSYGGGIRRSSAWANLIIGSFGIPVIGVVSSHMENRVLLRKVLNGGFVNSDNLPDKLLLEFNSVGGQKGYRNVERSTFSNWQSWLAARERYNQITTPVTLIYSQQDWSLPQERTDNATLIPHASVISIEDAGHFSSLDQPEKVVEIIKAGVRL